MSEFELSTLAVLALLLLGVGAYSYWQIYRAQKIQEAQKWRQEQEEAAEEAAHKSRYPSYDPAYVEEQEPLPETWPSAPESVHTDDDLTRVQESELDELPPSSIIKPHAESRVIATATQAGSAPLHTTAVESTPEDDVPAFLKKEAEDHGNEVDSSETYSGDEHTPEVSSSASHVVERSVEELAAPPAAFGTAEPEVEPVAEQMTEELRPSAHVTTETSVVHELEDTSALTPTVVSPLEETSPAMQDVVQLDTEHMVAIESDRALEEAKDALAAPMVTASVASVAASVVPVISASSEPVVVPASTPMSVSMSAPAPVRNEPAEIAFDVTDEEEKERIEQRVTAQELKRRAAWDVFAPFARFEHWLHTAYPRGVDPIRAIDAEIEIAVSQPKTSADIERALYDLRLDTPLPLRLYGARAGQISLDSGAKKNWQDLEPGAPYCALKLTLQLANRSHCAKEDVLQHWFALAESLRKRLSGHIETLPDVHELAEYARFLHALARRVGQPIILQLHKENGLWPAYEVHQQLTACGAVLNDRGIYIARNERNTPVYTVVNDVNNPRAQDFFRDQMAMMYVHTLSFCVELARIELHAQDMTTPELAPIQRLLDDMKTVAGALDAQWQNNLGETLDVAELEKIAHEQTRIFAQQLTELGLPVGALMTKRLLLG